MGKKGGASVIDLFVGLFKIAIGLVGLVGLVLVAVVKLVGLAVGSKKPPEPGGTKPDANRRPTFEDFHHTGATKEESFNNYLAALGVPPKPKFKQFSHSGDTYEKSQENFLNALQEWRDNYEVTVYGHRWEDAHGDDE